jgi:hypothetical protein
MTERERIDRETLLKRALALAAVPTGSEVREQRELRCGVPHVL